MRRMVRGLVVAGWACGLLGAGCATGRGEGTGGEVKPAANAPQEGEAFSEFAPMPKGPKPVEGYQGAAPAEADASPVAAAEALPAEGGQRGAGSAIQRAALDRFLGQGPSYALALAQVQPSFQAGRFEGFQIVSFSPEGQSLLGATLRPGDVVVRVNRRSISRPEDYMAAWESLKGCAEVTVQIVRQGQTMELIFPVEG